MSTEAAPGSRTPRVLIVEDDEDIAQLLAHSVRKAGFDAAVMLSGAGVLARVRDSPPDLLLLDVMLPGLDGRDICRALRADPQIQAVPVIMITARADEAERVAGLDLGADDYITKPFSPREVVARVRVVLRRVGAEREQEPASIHFRQLAVDFVSHAARLRGEPLRLTPKEFRLLETLIKQPGRAWSRLDLLEQVFGFDYEGLERTVDVHVMNLRRKIEHDPTRPEYIQTVYGVGYKFAEDDDVV